MSITQQEKQEIKDAILERVKVSENNDLIMLAKQTIAAFEVIEAHQN